MSDSVAKSESTRFICFDKNKLVFRSILLPLLVKIQILVSLGVTLQKGMASELLHIPNVPFSMMLHAFL